MRLAEGVAAGNERHGLFVVHRHAAEGLADVARGGNRIGRAIGPLGIDVDEAHLHRAERIGELAVAAVPLVAQPGRFRAPVDLFGFPAILASTGEAERLEAHRLERDVAGQHHQIRPRELAAVFFLDRPQQTAGLVEIGVVGPAAERREPQHAGPGAAAAVVDAVSTRAVPGHADEERTVVAEVGGPPCLRIRHHLLDVLLDGIEIE
jgi:hypothetical protein